jgi:L-amino acid N-acyltransferase YncA
MSKDLLAWKYDVLEYYNGPVLTLRAIIYKYKKQKLIWQQWAAEGNRNHFENIVINHQ